MALDDRRAATEESPVDPAVARRVPQQPVDVFGLPVPARRPRLGADLVEEWKRHALDLVRERQRELAGEWSIKLRVTPGFVLVASLAGLTWGVAGGLVSLMALLSARLLQQLPGAWWTRRHGKSALITVSALGDALEPSPSGRLRVVEVLLGSVVNVLVAAAVWFAFPSNGQQASLIPTAEVVAVTHAAWAIGQCLPLVPFQTGRALSQRMTPVSQLVLSVVSFAILAAFGTFALRRAELSALLPVLVVAAVAAAGEGRLAAFGLRERSAALVLQIQRAEAALAHDDPGGALKIVQAALRAAELEASRSRLHYLMAWAAIGKADPFLAHGAMQRLPGRQLSIDLVAAYLGCCNRDDEAIQLLRDARVLGQRGRETSKLLIELLVKTGFRDDATQVVADDRRLLAMSDLQALRRVGIG